MAFQNNKEIDQVMNESDFMHWYYEEASPADRALHDRLYEFDELFEDMCFEPGTLSYGLIKCQSKPAGSDEWVDDEAPRPEELEYFSYETIKTRVTELSDCEGYYSAPEKLLCLDVKVADDDATLLHEMIHLHEDVINELPLYFHDMLYWALYQDLKKKIVDLDDAITEHAHILNESTLYESGGLHDILFLLKSFDLDIKQGYPLGTVFAYGRTEEFKSLSYKN